MLEPEVRALLDALRRLVVQQYVSGRREPLGHLHVEYVVVYVSLCEGTKLAKLV